MSSKIIFALLLIFAVPALAEEAPKTIFYKYANNAAEYSVLLPEAPSVKTIRTNPHKEMPYMIKPLEDGAVGETAVFKRVDTDTGEYFDVQITFLKAGHDFLSGLTREKIQAVLENDLKKTALKHQKFDMLTSPKTGLKWATLTGFSLDSQQRPVYNALHYLTGQQSVLVIKIQYNVENKTFANYYQKLSESITYRPL